MWTSCFIISLLSILVLLIAWAFLRNTDFARKIKFNLFTALSAGAFLASACIYFPAVKATVPSGIPGTIYSFLVSAYNSAKILAFGGSLSPITSKIAECPENLALAYQIWVAALFLFAPVFTAGFVMSFFKGLSAKAGYRMAYFKDVYVFSSLNTRSISLARDIKKNHPDCALVFANAFEGGKNSPGENINEAKKLGAICFKKDISSIKLEKHSAKKLICIFAIAENENENLEYSLKLIAKLKDREHTHIYIFSSNTESELLLAHVDRGHIKVRRINEVLSLINRNLYKKGNVIFEGAQDMGDGTKHISAVIVGMGRHGTEMVKALSWYTQMIGYRAEINAFDKDPLACERFTMLAPELMSKKYNGVLVKGEAQYTISVHAGIDMDSITFSEEIEKIKNATYVMVALGSDEANIKTAVRLRMYFERLNIHPTIVAIVYDSKKRKALENAENYKGQKYDIEFIGDYESSYTEEVIMYSTLENEALERHLAWGTEEEFWAYEYNYRSSIALAIHRKIRKELGIPGADKEEKDLTQSELDIIGPLEHRRWNAYMRSEGYVFSGSKDKSSRNDLAKMHHDLVNFDSLSEEEKIKDYKMGAK